MILWSHRQLLALSSSACLCYLHDVPVCVIFMIGPMVSKSWMSVKMELVLIYWATGCGEVRFIIGECK